MQEEALGGGVFVTPGSQSISDIIIVFSQDQEIYLDREMRNKLVNYIERWDSNA